jgi:hypothetical protein
MNCPHFAGCDLINPLFIKTVNPNVANGVILAAIDPVIESHIIKKIDGIQRQEDSNQ